MMQIYAAGQPIENRVTADYANLRGGTIELPAIYEASMNGFARQVNWRTESLRMMRASAVGQLMENRVTADCANLRGGQLTSRDVRGLSTLPDER